MSFQSRLIGAVMLVTMVTLGGAFAAISMAVNRSQERQLDDALRAAALEEARELADRPAADLSISGRPGPAANDVGPLTKYGALYRSDGAVLAATATFGGRPPALGSLRARPGVCFDQWVAGEHLRAVLVPIRSPVEGSLLLAAPRADLDGDESFLARAMAVVLLVAVIWTALVASWVVRRLTRHHQAVTEVVRRVAAGDLDARVGLAAADPETAQLGRDVDDMVSRLGALVQAQRRFVAHAAHELRSPLTTLYGELSHALRRSREAAEYRLAIEEALDASRRLKVLTEDLLTLARLEASREEPRQPLSPETMVREAVQQVEGEARERGVQIVVHGQAPSVDGREGDLVRMVRNLVENAVRHSPGGGRVDVSLAAADGGVELRVTDEGPGIPGPERARVFEPFYRGPREQAEGVPGAGLGLPIVREIARAHGGDVAVEDVCRGARVSVWIPSARPGR